MAGLDLPETDIILFDRLGEGGNIDTAKIVQSIGRAIRAQKKGVEENKRDHDYYRNHGHSRHPPKIVVFIDKFKKPKPKESPPPAAAPSPADAPTPAAAPEAGPSSSSTVVVGRGPLPELPEGQVWVEAGTPRYGTPPGHTDDEEEEEDWSSEEIQPSSGDEED